MLYLFLCLTALPYVYGGSECKPRADIYPCICIDQPIGKSKFDTTVVCHGLNDGGSILKIESALADMHINTFLLYDSYWSNNGLRRSETDARVAVNFLSSFKMEEIKVVDSDMSFFSCPKEYNCRTSYLKRFTVINSTLSETPCDNALNINIWISCPSIIEHVIIDTEFKDLSLKADFFPQPMPKLKALHMPRNRISRIERRTFSLTKFPALETLDVSHNSIRDGKSIFSAMLKLRHLDLSFNTLRSLVEFQYLPHLQTLMLQNNQLMSLVPNEWSPTPLNLKLIDLSNNNILCNCGIEFVNSTFNINAVFLGNCGEASHRLVKGKTFRKASRFLIERCDEQGNVGARKPKAKASKPAK